MRATLTVVLSLLALTALAQGTVTLNGTNTNSCVYSSISITPNAVVNVQCVGGLTNTPGAFSFTAATASGPAHTSVQATIQRTGGTLGDYGIYYWYEGPGCARTEAGGPLAFANGVSSHTILIPMGSSGVCTATIGQVSAPATFGAHRSIAVTVTSSGPFAGCPAPPHDMKTAEFPHLGMPAFVTAAQGQVVSMPIPATGLGSGQVSLTETPQANSPNQGVVEMTVSKCPGVIETDARNFCNHRGVNALNNDIVFLTKAHGAINASTADQYGYCWAGEPNTKYYLNARWISYTTCYTANTYACGYAAQVFAGPY